MTIKKYGRVYMTWFLAIQILMQMCPFKVAAVAFEVCKTLGQQPALQSADSSPGYPDVME